MTSPHTGFFVTVEGIEGSGKSTQIAFIRDLLERAGQSVLVTREPGGTHIGEALRGLLLDPGNSGLDSDTEILMMFAARAEHLARVIRPALAGNQWVVCDRFTDATYAYQGGGRGIPLSRIAALEDWVQGELRPDLTLLLDVPVGIGMGRATSRGPADRFEQERHDFFERVRDNYLSRARNEPRRFRVVDASPPVVDVERALARILREALASETPRRERC
jgi:dTMP kinase